MANRSVIWRRCPICLHDTPEHYQLIYRVRDFDVIRCRSCGLTFVNAEILPSEPNQDYAIDLYQNHAAIYEKIARRQFRQLERLLSGIAIHPRVLDIGCGFGYFPREAQAHGWETYGVEINTMAIQYAQRNNHVRVVCASADEGLPFVNDFFDIVTMYGLIEHLPNPPSCVSECARVLKRGGLLALVTPTEDGLIRAGGRWLTRLTGGKVTFHVHQLYQLGGGHNLIFSRRSLRLLLEKQGLEPLRICGSTYGLGVLLPRFHSEPTLRRWTKAIGTAVLFMAGQILGLPNHMTAFARRT